MKAVVAAFNQEKALVGAFSVITNFRMELFGALASCHDAPSYISVMINPVIHSLNMERRGIVGEISVK